MSKLSVYEKRLQARANKVHKFELFNKQKVHMKWIVMTIPREHAQKYNMVWNQRTEALPLRAIPIFYDAKKQDALLYIPAQSGMHGEKIEAELARIYAMERYSEVVGDFYWYGGTRQRVCFMNLGLNSFIAPGTETFPSNTRKDANYCSHKFCRTSWLNDLSAVHYLYYFDEYIRQEALNPRTEDLLARGIASIEEDEDEDEQAAAADDTTSVMSDETVINHMIDVNPSASSTPKRKLDDMTTPATVQAAQALTELHSSSSSSSEKSSCDESQKKKCLQCLVSGAKVINMYDYANAATTTAAAAAAAAASEEDCLEFGCESSDGEISATTSRAPLLPIPPSSPTHHVLEGNSQEDFFLITLFVLLCVLFNLIFVYIFFNIAAAASCGEPIWPFNGCCFGW
jgi:hypothetical protein